MKGQFEKYSSKFLIEADLIENELTIKKDGTEVVDVQIFDEKNNFLDKIGRRIVKEKILYKRLSNDEIIERKEVEYIILTEMKKWIIEKVFKSKIAKFEKDGLKFGRDTPWWLPLRKTTIDNIPRRSTFIKEDLRDFITKKLWNVTLNEIDNLPYDAVVSGEACYYIPSEEYINFSEMLSELYSIYNKTIPKNPKMGIFAESLDEKSGIISAIIAGVSSPFIPVGKSELSFLITQRIIPVKSYTFNFNEVEELYTIPKGKFIESVDRIKSMKNKIETLKETSIKKEFRFVVKTDFLDEGIRFTTYAIDTHSYANLKDIFDVISADEYIII